MKIALVVMGGCIVFVFVVTGAFLGHISSDIPEADDSDLAIIHKDIPATENAFNWLPIDHNNYFWPTNSTFITRYINGEEVDDGLLQETIALNSNAFVAIKKGIRFKACVTPEVTGFDTPLPYVPVWLNCGKWMAAKVRFERLAGCYDDATDTCITMLRFGDMIQRNSETMISYLVGLSCMRFGLAQARGLYRDPALSSTQRAQLTCCLSGLGPFDAGMVNVIKTEYQNTSGFIDDLAKGTNVLGDIINLARLGDGKSKLRFRNKVVRGYTFQPNRTKRLFAELYRNLITNAHRPYAEMALTNPREKFGLDQETYLIMLRPNAIGRIVAAIMLPACNRALIRSCEVAGMLNATRLLGALTAYRADYGFLPENLKVLIPDYLSEIPLDPFDGMPLRYNSEKRIVYALGENLVDDGGSIETDSSYAQRSNIRDFVFGIDDEIRFNQ